jgi:aspartate/methionine/tyrosine aminotransferase
MVVLQQTAEPLMAHEAPVAWRRSHIRHDQPVAAEQGILVAPGDCFDIPSHFRLGFAATGHKFPQALDRLGEFVTDWPAKIASRQSA